jgi:uncharacterized Ntn-hydrolase superfamily protein
VYIIYGAAPGLGVIHAQASANLDGRDRGVELLEQGVAPALVISEITASSFDSNSEVRQYGVADSTGRTAGFTGASDRAFAGDRQGSAGTFSYSVQGNILTSEAVLSQAAAAFEAEGCDLAERLMRALEAGADNGEGDSRCTPDGIPSDSSFIQVERADTPRGSYLELHVRSSGSDSPIPPLREQFDEWRATHPCPGPPGGGGGGSGGGAGSASGGRASGGTASAGASAAGAPVSAGSAGASAMNRDGASDDDSGGCGCRSRVPSGAHALALAALVLAMRGVRRRGL